MALVDHGASAWSRALNRAPGWVALIVVVLTVASAFAASQLRINTNQLDLISQDLRQVKDVKRVVDMIGGSGHLILALRGGNPELLQKVADDLAAKFTADKEHVRAVTYKVDVEFLRKNGALFMETPDLEEVRRRVMLKMRDAIRRANPFFMEIEETKPVELKLDDIIDKYTRIGKRSIRTDYYLSDDKQMLLILVKPMWDSNLLEQTGELVASMRQTLTDYSKSNSHKVTLVEDYDKSVPSDVQQMEYGFTGTYQTNYDDSYQIQGSLVPVTGWALLGVTLVLLVFFRRAIAAVVLVLSALLIGIVLTMGFAKVAIGELNMITSILAGVLMGLGIDFGIHQLYRLGEELARGRPLPEALTRTVASAGVASLVSAGGTAIAFASLLPSEFAGFSQFGLLAAAGVILTGTAIWTWVPAVLLLLEERRPGIAARMLKGLAPKVREGKARHLRRPGLVLAVMLVLFGAISAFAPQVMFEYNTRALMVENQPSVRLQDELNERYQISADPVGVYTKTREQARELYEMFHPLDKTKYSTVDQFVSVFAFVPPADRQQRNAAVLKSWREELAELDRKSLPPDMDEKWDEAMSYLTVEPYAVDKVPPALVSLFQHLPTAKPENHGWLTFIYPTVDLWDGKQMLQFADQIEEIKTPSGETWHSAGMPILFAKLARIVMHDAKMAVLWSAVGLIFLLLFDLRSPTRSAVALAPLAVGVSVMLGLMALLGVQLNFMNIVVLPVVLGYGLSHGVYLMHRFDEGTPPMEALRSVGAAVAASTLTTLAGWGALLAASHRGMQSMGSLACLGMVAPLLVTFTLMPALLELLSQRKRVGKTDAAEATP